MRVCKNDKCENIIPKRMLFDGKYRNLTSRKQCIICLPFMTSPYSNNEEERQEKRKESQRRKSKKFYDKQMANGIAPVYKQRRINYKQILIDMLGGKCKACGYNKSTSALCFHHRDPEQKSFPLSKREMVFSLDRLKKEAEKCDLLCLNCHAEEHESWVGI